MIMGVSYRKGRDIIFCGKCGTNIEDDATFCGACGSPVENDMTDRLASQSRDNRVPLNNQPLTKKKNLGPLIVILAFVAVVLIGILWYMLSRDASAFTLKSQKSENQPQKSEISLPTVSPSPVVVENTEAPAAVEYSAPVFDMTSASNITYAKEGRNYSPYLAQDGQPDNTWSVTGGSNEWIILSSETEQYLSGIKILNGYTKYSSDYGFWVYYRNNRPKDITISLSDGTSINKTLDDVFDESNYHYQNISFDVAKKTKFVKITINSVYEGDKWNDTCISEIQVY